MTSVLIVEDDPICQKINASLCRLSGMETTVAETGKDALSLLSSKDFDLVLMDIGLPDMNGIEVAEQVKKQSPQIPIVAVTAHMGNDQPTGPFDRVIHKPLMKQIIHTIKEELLVKGNV